MKLTPLDIRHKEFKRGMRGYVDGEVDEFLDEIAEELRANAQKEAQLMLSEAELKARQMVNDSYADKQAVEKQIVVPKSSEEDFRFKFRSLLDGYTNQLAEVEAAAKKTGRFATPTDEIKQAMAHDAANRPGAPTP